MVIIVISLQGSDLVAAKQQQQQEQQDQQQEQQLAPSDRGDVDRGDVDRVDVDRGGQAQEVRLMELLSSSIITIYGQNS